MYQIRELTGNISNKQREEIIELVGNNAEDISAFVVQRDSPFYEYVRVREITRARMFLDFLKKDEPEKTYLIVAEDSGKIIGYLLYNRDVTCRDDVSICSTVVSDNYRSQGIFTNMINLLKTKTKSISLSCFMNKVSFYQKFGFKIDESFETQVGMFYGTYSGDGMFLTINDDELGSQSLVLAEMSKVMKRFGKSFQKELNSFLMESEREKEKVKKFIEY
ncbi:GNAT family N-acetyltransferase [Bacillus sp. RG28]|uniref:GNAT family N-acetyltransferase n=1 Tax=Gottfriedia endophytica TaxID=2820819 RepID=A0A940SFF1_9BACI|nr:GNAT family N-acetyltransferase [Gottfriedia endophytica]MBP0723932.1 GNAT family N-acetyltransferase [Gottfriedia endophytica]